MKPTAKTDVICIEKVQKYIALIDEAYSAFNIKSFKDFENSPVCQLATTQALTNIHEVQKKIQPETMATLTMFANLRFNIKASRNIASHDYEKVNFEIVYKTTQALFKVDEELEAVKNALG